MHTLLPSSLKCMAENCMILILNLNQLRIKLYGLPAMKISFAFAGVFHHLSAIISYKIRDHIPVVILLVLKHTFRPKIILQRTLLLFPGITHSKGNGCFINSGDCLLYTSPSPRDS